MIYYNDSELMDNVSKNKTTLMKIIEQNKKNSSILVLGKIRT